MLLDKLLIPSHRLLEATEEFILVYPHIPSNSLIKFDLHLGEVRTVILAVYDSLPPHQRVFVVEHDLSSDHVTNKEDPTSVVYRGDEIVLIGEQNILHTLREGESSDSDSNPKMRAKDDSRNEGLEFLFPASGTRILRVGETLCKSLHAIQCNKPVVNTVLREKGIIVFLGRWVSIDEDSLKEDPLYC